MWGTHGGLNSPNYWFTGGSLWSSSPSNEQLLKDFAGNALAATGHTSNTNDFDGDLIELGFFASDLGTDNAAGGTGVAADTPSTNLFEGTWIPLTTKTYIGQDWGTGNGTGAKEAVDAGEFEFKSTFLNSGSWQDYVNHNNDEGAGYTANADHDIMGAGGDNQAILSDHLDALTSATKLGIRFYDSNGKNNGTTSYNTIMNDSWTWGGSGAQVNMFLHKQSSPDDLADGLKFEFDNSDYASVSEKAGSGVNSQSSDFVTTITYWTGLNSNLTLTSSDQNHVLSGLNDPILDTGDTIGNITGGSDNKLTLNVNGEGTTSNAYSFSGDIVDTGAAGGLEIVKTGTGKQTLTGSLDMESDENSILNIYQGTLALATASGKTHKVEYLKGETGTTLELADGDSDIITLGFANTTSYSDADFGGNVLISGSDDQTVTVSSGTGATDYEKEQTFSGSLAASGSGNLVKDGVGKLRLTGDSSTNALGNFDNSITVSNGTLIIGDGSDGDAALHGSTTITVETGKLEIANAESIANNVAGSTTSTKKSMIGGKGSLTTGEPGLKIGSASGEIDVISPGHGISSSLTNTSSQQQVSLGNGTDSIGTFTVTNLNLNNGAIYDWEISDFDGSAGSGWDVLAFTDLDFQGGAINLNIFGLQSNGTAGANSGNTFAAKTGATSGFKFLEGPNSGTINWGTFNGGTNPGAGTTVSSLFNINQQGWSHYNHHYGNWSVYYDGNTDFYLQYSAVPEPSTYVMVTCLLMLPGYNFVRRMRKKKSLSKDEEEDVVS